MQHVILPTASRQESLDAPAYKLFSSGQIAVAAIFGSILTGGLMLANNYSKLGDKKAARRAVILSLLAFVFLWVGSATLLSGASESSARSLMSGINLWLAVVFKFMVDRWQGDQYADHLRRGGERVSGWIFAAIIVTVFAASIALVIMLLNYANG